MDTKLHYTLYLVCSNEMLRFDLSTELTLHHLDNNLKNALIIANLVINDLLPSHSDLLSAWVHSELGNYKLKDGD